MPTIRERVNGTFELRIVHKSLPRPYYSTHDDRAAAERYAKEVVKALAIGYIPPELKEETRQSLPITQLLRAYLKDGPISPTDREMVAFLQDNLTVTIKGVTVKWVDTWVVSMKKAQLKPGTIRKRVESLARAVDWWNRREYESEQLPMNPLRTLPRGYSAYREAEVKVVDTERDRRLAPGEVEKIEATILGKKRDDRQRPMAVPHAQEFLWMFRLILNTGLRLREAYSIKVRDLRMDTRTVFIPKSKTGRSREVPLVPVLYNWIAGGQIPAASETLLFPFWTGNDDDLRGTTNRLSGQFRRVFEYAGCEDLVEHDLRHEATCRWMLMRNSSGQWLFRPEEVRRITGHKSVQQFERYLSLRGSDLSDRLWNAD